MFQKWELLEKVQRENFMKYANMTVFGVINFLYLFLAVHKIFWYDEAYTVGMINRDFADIISVTARDVHSPFYYFALKLFYTFPGMHQLISIKVFSWLFADLYLVAGGGNLPETIWS